MILDAHNLFSDAQVLTTGSENGIASSNVIDLGLARDLGTGENLYVVVSVDTAFTDSSSNTDLAVILQTDAYVAFNSAATGQTIGTLPALSAVGDRLVARIQPGGANEQYIRLFYTAGNGAMTTCAVTAFLTHDVQAYTSYNDNVSVLG